MEGRLNPPKPRPVAFVTGAARGIGRGIAIELARNGYDIVGNATNYNPAQTGSGLAEVQARVEALGAAFAPAPGDIAELDQHERLLAVALARFQRVDLLVNNAGVAPVIRRDILETTPESYDRVLSVNSRGPFFFAQRVARQMMKQVAVDPTLPAAIIFISSISADTSSPGRVEYCVSKAAMSQMARVFAHRLAEIGINVYEVRPGLIKTDMTEPVQIAYDAKIEKGLIPQKRWGLPEDVGRAVASLARGDFNYSTGMIVEVSGGLNIRRL
ncbi:MAG: 3-ketoacyl-ACP reductase [Candidatus Eisenbacteria bacterium]|uniref:3-ketoacyl-ACP reductase n=1 Tax=Eiseniibacteriota bacterium TaxID=2212470 RepID=A0A948RY05_UNCEI|nr:3-ketoacyl-ACP reductase [Candidatus Eisenbacteria bacterium]MBU1947715.1 3-ketoacyl-ACP reductase [Candidatus Eisenbacteria bacterium]MBU2692041.1 3-ketoacyl-ACP reductase [Candidatus Eisenbacteria bacterium]